MRDRFGSLAKAVSRFKDRADFRRREDFIDGALGLDRGDIGRSLGVPKGAFGQAVPIFEDLAGLAQGSEETFAGFELLQKLGCAGAGEVVKFYEDYLFDVGVGPAPFQDDIIEQFELVLGENFSGEFPGFNPHSAHGEDQTGSAIAKMLLGPVFID